MKIKKRSLQFFGCILIMTVFLLSFVSISFAADINMNHINSANTVTNDTTGNETAGSTNTTTQTGSSNLPVSSSSTTVSNMLPESNLGLATILNILLITVGVILILLGIAVLIRLK